MEYILFTSLTQNQVTSLLKNNFIINSEKNGL